MTVEVLLPLALVLITGYYALQTRKTVSVMEDSIRAQQQPRLVMQVGRGGDFWSGVWIMNEGSGPAIDPFLKVSFIPPPATNRQTHRQEVRVSVISGDLRVAVDGPKRDGDVVGFDTLCRDYDVIRLEGEMTDSLGQRHVVRQELKDLRAFARHSEVGFEVEHERLLKRLLDMTMGLHRVVAQLSGIREVLDTEDEDDSGNGGIEGGDDEVPF